MRAYNTYMHKSGFGQNPDAAFLLALALFRLSSTSPLQLPDNPWLVLKPPGARHQKAIQNALPALIFLSHYYWNVRALLSSCITEYLVSMLMGYRYCSFFLHHEIRRFCRSRQDERIVLHITTLSVPSLAASPASYVMWPTANSHFRHLPQWFAAMIRLNRDTSRLKFMPTNGPTFAFDTVDVTSPLTCIVLCDWGLVRRLRVL